MPAPRPRPISDFLPKIQNVAQTSQYIVKFALPVSSVRSFLRRKGVIRVGLDKAEIEKYVI